MDEDPTGEHLEKLSQAVLDYVNATDPEAPVLVRGWAISIETQIFTDKGEPAYRIIPVQGTQTSNAHALGLMNFGANYLTNCLLNH